MKDWLNKTWIVTGFFGWNNFKWNFIQLRNIYSHKPSFYSKKRFESGAAFIVLQWGMIYFLTHKISSMSTSDFILWASVEAIICGYTLDQIEKSKIKDANILKDSQEKE